MNDAGVGATLFRGVEDAGMLSVFMDTRMGWRGTRVSRRVSGDTERWEARHPALPGFIIAPEAGDLVAAGGGMALSFDSFRAGLLMRFYVRGGEARFSEYKGEELVGLLDHVYTTMQVNASASFRAVDVWIGRAADAVRHHRDKALLGTMIPLMAGKRWKE